MTDRLISNIAFLDDGVVIEYIEATDHPIQRSVSLALSADFVEKADPQLKQDFAELIADANTLLDSVHLAYHETGSRLTEMGRT
jgi:hypothetical protein